MPSWRRPARGMAVTAHCGWYFDSKRNRGLWVFIHRFLVKHIDEGRIVRRMLPVARASPGNPIESYTKERRAFDQDYRRYFLRNLLAAFPRPVISYLDNQVLRHHAR